MPRSSSVALNSRIILAPRDVFFIFGSPTVRGSGPDGKSGHGHQAGQSTDVPPHRDHSCSIVTSSGLIIRAPARRRYGAKLRSGPSRPQADLAWPSSARRPILVTALRQPGLGISDATPAPNRKYKEGTTNRLSSVEVTRPPRMTTAIGYSISWPGYPRPRPRATSLRRSLTWSSGSATAALAPRAGPARARRSHLHSARDAGSGRSEECCCARQCRTP